MNGIRTQLGHSFTEAQFADGCKVIFTPDSLPIAACVNGHWCRREASALRPRQNAYLDKLLRGRVARVATEQQLNTLVETYTLEPDRAPPTQNACCMPE